MITTIILTFNEEKHIKRCVENALRVSNQIYIVDSFSSDRTIEIAESLGAYVVQREFINQAEQFQWALENLDLSNEWVLRLDADEFLTVELVKEINDKIPFMPHSCTGLYLKRRVYFMGRWIKYGGYYPTKLLRLWRKGAADVEQKWMDEHMKIKFGETLELDNDFIDDNLNSLHWWIQKHNNYASREALEYLNSKYRFYKADSIELNSSQQDASKRRLKNNVYYKLPPLIRPILYFWFRYGIKLGFLDGRAGFIWHVLQGFWYRFLVDCKIIQIESTSNGDQENMKDMMIKEFNIKLK